MEGAAQTGQLDMLQWILDQSNAPWQDEPCYAAVGGQLDTLNGYGLRCHPANGMSVLVLLQQNMATWRFS
jgi:hypothetical protein